MNKQDYLHPILALCTSEQLQFLDALEAAGVDNWVGYEDAIDLMTAEE